MARHGEERRAPIDAKVVAGLLQDRLLLVAKAQYPQLARFLPIPDDLLVRHVDGPLRGHVDIEAHVVGRAIERARAKPHIARRARDELEVVEQERADEHHLELHGVRLEAVDRPGRLHVERDLAHAFGENLGPAHEPQRLAVDAHDAAERELGAGPVARPLVVKAIGERPAAGVRIDGDEGNGRRTQRRSHASISRRGSESGLSRR